MFFNLPFMDDSSKDDVPDFLKGDTSSAFDDLFASANVPETFDDIPDFLKGDDNAFLEALGVPAGASDDTISKLIAALTPATQDRDDPNFFEGLLGGLLGGKKSSGINLGQLGLGLGLASLLKDRGAFDPDIAPVGYQGEVPRYTAIREQVTGRDDTNRRPGSGGRRYFSDVIYAKAPEGQEPMSVEEARAAAKAQAAGFSRGSMVENGGYLEGSSDGQADLIPANIDGVQEARLSHGEFVLPADVVAMLGNGNSDAGAEALDDFMKSIRTKATGTPKQQKNIDADKVLMMLSKKAG